MNEHNENIEEIEECISCIKDGLTGICRDIKDKKARQLIAELDTSLTNLRTIVNNITGTSADLATVEMLNQVITDFNNVISELELSITNLDENKADITNDQQILTAKELEIKNERPTIKFKVNDDENPYTALIYVTKDFITLATIWGVRLQALHNNIELSTENDILLSAGIVKVDGDLEVTGNIKNLNKIVLDITHPVNSIIEIEDDTFNPNVYYAGTGSVWERLPDGYVLWSASSGAGETINAGLPNITGSLDAYPPADNGRGQVSGAFTRTENSSNYTYTGTSANTRSITRFYFDASQNGNTLYGKSNTVQPPARKTCMWKRVS